jgi:ribosomal-protein-alanine N-acetyltransferase
MNTPAIILRPMTEQDIPAVVEIDQNSFSLPWPERSFRFEVVDNMASRCWVAQLGDNIVGMLVLWLIVDEAHVATIATHPQYRRMGIARQLLGKALEDAKAEGAVDVVLEVRSTNEAAQAMYKKFGFETTGRREKYYKDNNEDALLMSVKL